MPEVAADRPFDPYKVLQVDPEADPEVIQAAYRRLAQKFHPDVAPGPEAALRMVAINQAWQVLRDPERRAAHDLERRAPQGRVPGTTRPAEGLGAAGRPPGNPSGSVMSFGRYAGWSLGEIARRDLEYVEWLDRVPIGRQYREEIDAILRRAGRRGAADADEGSRRGLFRRR